MTKYVMGIDNGSTAIKAAIYDESGNELAVSGSVCEIVSPEPGYYERDMDGIWQANCEAISGAIERAGIDPADIQAVSITGHGNGVHLIGPDGRPAYNSIEGMDARAAEIVAGWESDGTYDSVHPRAMQKLWPGLTCSLLRWLTEHKPDVLDKTKWIFSIVDYVRFMLTGTAGAEITTLSGSGLLNITARSYDDEIFKILGISELKDKLPPLVESIELCGTVTKQAAQLTGLKEGTPVSGGMYDIDSAGVAAGMLDESLWNVIAGTWCNNQFISSSPVVSKDFFSTTVFSKPGYWLMLEGSPTSASNLEWFVREFLQEEKKQAKLQGRSVYEICNAAVEHTGPDDADIVFVPYLYGSNTNPKAKAVFLGLEGWHTRAHVIRAIYEGICFSHRYHIEKIRRYRQNPQAVRIAGGAARSKVWVQMFADILAMPMEVTAASEPGTLGAAMCAGVATGMYADFDQAAEKMVKVIRRVEPDPNKADIYSKKFNRFKKAIESLDSFWG
jgi:L-xylulokinase